MVQRLARHRWDLAFAIALIGIAARNLVALATLPPGLYVDEASIGYNAWTIAHFGVDEHGVSFPLFFQAFGEWKNPVYIYLLVPFVWLFGLSAAVVRAPAALLGIVTALALAGFARRATGSRLVALVTLLVAGATPWLTLESRAGFEVPAMVACLAVMLWCLAGGVSAGADRLWYGLAGVALGLSVYAYTVGRLEGILLAAAALFCFGRGRQLRRLAFFVVPVAAAYLLLAVWASEHPGQLTVYFNGISILAGHPPVWRVAADFVANFVSYFAPPFLFVSGDAYLRQSTGFGGVLLVATLPLVVAGIVACVRRWREPLPRFVLVALVLAPVAAALTNEDTPHALRDATALPFWLATMAYGLDGLLPLLSSRRIWAAALAAAVAAETAAYTVDLFASYPTRAAIWFDAPEVAAIARARDLAGGRTVWLSSQLQQPYIEACFIAQPRPPSHPVGGRSPAIELAESGFGMLTEGDPGAEATTGDILVLGGSEHPPASTVPLFTESASEPSGIGGAPQQVVVVRVWRVR